MTTSLSTAAATSPPTRGPSPCHTTSNSPACPTSRQEDSPRLPARPVDHHYWRQSRGSSLLEDRSVLNPVGLPVHHGRHEDATDGRHAADGHGRLLHAHDAPAPALLHSGPDPCSTPLATTAGSAKARRYARHGHGRNGDGRWRWTPGTPCGRTQSWAAAAETYEPTWTPANDHDGQARHATSAYGWCPSKDPSN